MSGTAWQVIGNAPAQDPYLSRYGGMVVADVNSNDQDITPPSVSWGSVTLSHGAAGSLYYNDLVSGTGTFKFGSSTCGPYTQQVGIYSTVRCKFAPIINSVGPLLSGTARVVRAGTTISISGVGFGAQQCSSCRVTASNPQSVFLQISSWSDGNIQAFLPISFTGFSTIGVTTASGQDYINVMAAPAQQPPPVLTVSVTNNGNFTQGQSGAVYTITIGNSASAGPTSGTVTVTEILPSGLTLVSMSGTGWSCSSNVCTRGDTLNAGSSYPVIIVTVNVSITASSPLINQVSLSGGGSSSSASGSDPTNINPGQGCTYTVSPLNFVVSPAGGPDAITVTTQAGCSWTAVSNAAWITIGTLTPTSVAYTATANVGGLHSGTLTVAGQTVTVTQGANNILTIPALVSLNPFQGTGPNATLTLVYSHPSGWAAIQSSEFIVNPRWESTTRSGGCYIKYAPATGLFTLIADDGSSVAGSTAPGSSANISNSQCTLNAASSSATGSGNTLTIVAALTFSASFTGQRHIWMQAVDYNNLSTNWLVYGVWFPTATTVNAIPWYRIYDPFSNSYLYSADQNEYNTLGTRGFVLQGISGLVMDTPTFISGISNMAWYRVYVNSTNSHLWTSDRNEFLILINQQQAYVGEGVATFVMPYINALGQVSPQVTNSIPFYRAAYQGANLHFWTSDPNEFFGTNGEHLPPGYFGEGIACYIFPASGAQLSSEPGTPMVTAAVPAEQDDGGPALVSATNGASYVSNGVVAAGQVLSIFGRHLGGRVLLNGSLAQMIWAQGNEMRVLVPNDLPAESEVTLEVQQRGRRSKPIRLDVVAANPAIFGSNAFGRGNAQAHNEDGTENGPEHPAVRGSVLTLYTTGLGPLDAPLEVHIGGRPAEVLSTQQSATRAGVIEVQVRVPEALEPAPFQPVVLRVGNLFSQPGVGFAIQ